MDTRIQFRLDEETKRLAQLMAERGAEKQRKSMGHDAWLSEQINAAFNKFDSGKARFVAHDDAKAQMEDRKQKLRN
ncbi:damage-inducible protein J [Pseudocolwellia agarivorans]|uniref:damage-inducible protein J n=1 Tax=Pseudocolwellia agarivorans TaxID=1911682 RepID=UPI000B5AEFC3|nr:damage-inducible protein J [Pseudocolwellia agarivorans]